MLFPILLSDLDSFTPPLPSLSPISLLTVALSPPLSLPHLSPNLSSLPSSLSLSSPLHLPVQGYSYLFILISTPCSFSLCR